MLYGKHAFLKLDTRIASDPMLAVVDEWWALCNDFPPSLFGGHIAMVCEVGVIFRRVEMLGYAR